MKPPALALIAVIAFTGCEKVAAPAPDQVTPAPGYVTPKPSPKPGEWLFKDHKNPLDQKPKR